MSSVVIAGDVSGSVTLQAPSVAGSTTLTLPATSGTVLTTASTTGISGSAITSGTVAEAYGGTGTSTGYYGFKNRLINGAMMIDQRNAGAVFTPTSGVQYGLDRWANYVTQASKFTLQQSSTVPAGFSTSLKLTSSSAYSVTSTDTFVFFQSIEGYNIADLAWGTASASAVTLSFKVYSSLTGTFSGSIKNNAGDRVYPFSYSVPVANTWTTISLTIPGDTTGTWLTNNGAGLTVVYNVGSGANFLGTGGAWGSANVNGVTGSVSVVGTNGATFYITGVQLEKGSNATSFDYRPYGTELALCQRYYEKSFDDGTAPANGANSTSLATGNGSSATVAGNNSLFGGPIRFAVQKRTAATITAYGNNSGYWAYVSTSASSTVNWSANTVLFANQGAGGFSVLQNVTNNVYYSIFGHWTASAEL